MSLIIQNASVNIKSTNFISQPVYRVVEPAQSLNLNVNNPSSYPGSGTTWYDVSGKGNNATLGGSPKPSYNSTGTPATASMSWPVYSFNVSTSTTGTRATIGSNYLGYDATIQLWINTTKKGRSNDYLSLMPLLNSVNTAQANKDSWSFGINSNGLLSYSSDSGSAGSTGKTISVNIPVNTGTWTNVAVTRTLSTGLVTLYINGLLKVTGTLGPNKPLNAPYPTVLGNSNYDAGGGAGLGYIFQGNMDGILTYGVVLTADEIWQNYSTTRKTYGI